MKSKLKWQFLPKPTLSQTPHSLPIGQNIAVQRVRRNEREEIFELHYLGVPALFGTALLRDPGRAARYVRLGSSVIDPVILTNPGNSRKAAGFRKKYPCTRSGSYWEKGWVLGCKNCGGIRVCFGGKGVTRILLNIFTTLFVRGRQPIRENRRTQQCKTSGRGRD